MSGHIGVRKEDFGWPAEGGRSPTGAGHPSGTQGVPPVVDFGFTNDSNSTTKGYPMDTREKLSKARLGLLALAEQWQNVRQACRAAGISRSHYYEIQQAYQK